MICWKVSLAGSISLLDLYLWNGMSVFTLTITDANYFHYSSVTFSHCFPTTMWQTFPASRTIWNNMTGIMFSPQWRKENDSMLLSSSGIWIAVGIYKVSPGARQSHRYFKKLKFQIKFQILNSHVNLCPKFNLSVNIPESRGIFFSLSLFYSFPSPPWIAFLRTILLIPLESYYDALSQGRRISDIQTKEHLNILVLGFRKGITLKTVQNPSSMWVTNYLLSTNLKENPNKFPTDRSLEIFMMYHYVILVYNSEGI